MSKSSKHSDDNRSRQLNPKDPAYHSSRQGSGDSQVARDNHSEQLNPMGPNYQPPKAGKQG